MVVIKSASKVHFEDLNDYILPEIFKYLPFKERLRFERINRRFAYNLNEVWKKQNRLAIRMVADQDQEIFNPVLEMACDKCHNRKHDIEHCDILLLKINGFWNRVQLLIGHKYINAIMTIVKKCSNLHVLDINASTEHSISFDQYRQLLAQCPQLVHLKLMDHSMDDYSKLLYEISSLYKLNCLSICTKEQKSIALEPWINKLTNLQYLRATLNKRSFYQLIKKNSLRKLNIDLTEPLDDCKKPENCPLVHDLKRLEAITMNRELGYHFEHNCYYKHISQLPRLTELTLSSHNEQFNSIPYFNRFGSQLKTLNVTGLEHRYSLLYDRQKVLSNLQSLSVIENVMIDGLIFKNLREVCIEMYYICDPWFDYHPKWRYVDHGVSNFKIFLANNGQLRKVICCSDKEYEDTLPIMIDYARKFGQRKMVFSFHSSKDYVLNCPENLAVYNYGNGRLMKSIRY